MSALLFDFGGVLLLTPFELLWRAERAMGLAEGSLPWTGPFDPAADELWRRWQSGQLTEREYWGQRAREAGMLIDRPEMDAVGLMHYIYDDPSVDELIRPEGAALVARAKAAGWVVGLLTNDLRAFHDDEWVARIAILEQFDPLVDLSRTTVLKPDPRAYATALDRMALPAAEVLFIDDQRGNIAGAEQAGLATAWFDVTRPRVAYAAISERVGLAA